MINFEEVFSLLIVAMATSALSITITRTSIFEKLRYWVAVKNSWVGELLTCPYCISHWISLAFTLVYGPKVIYSGFIAVDLLVSMFAIVALSAFFSGLIIKAFMNLPEEG